MVGFGTRLLMWKYLMRLLSSVWASVWRACWSGDEMMSVVSSAYVYTVDFVTVLMMPLM